MSEEKIFTPADKDLEDEAATQPANPWPNILSHSSKKAAVDDRRRLRYMGIRKVDINALAEAVDDWLYCYGLDLRKSNDPTVRLMDGTQDERVLICAANVLQRAGITDVAEMAAL
jgi:hypothetical protein